MTGERWQQVKTVIEAVLPMDSEKRRAYLDQACATDQTLRREVESLLAADKQAQTNFLQSPPLATRLEKGTRRGSAKDIRVGFQLHARPLVRWGQLSEKGRLRAGRSGTSNDGDSRRQYGVTSMARVCICCRRAEGKNSGNPPRTAGIVKAGIRFALSDCRDLYRPRRHGSCIWVVE